MLNWNRQLAFLLLCALPHALKADEAGHTHVPSKAGAATGRVVDRFAPLTDENIQNAIRAFDLEDGVFHKLMKLGKYEEALTTGEAYFDVLERAFEAHRFKTDADRMFPHRAVGYLAQGYEFTGQFEKAYNQFKRQAHIIERESVDPTWPKDYQLFKDAERSFSYSGMARNAHKLGRLPEAISHSQKVVELLTPVKTLPQQNMSARVRLARQLIDIGAADKAEKFLLEAREIGKPWREGIAENDSASLSAYRDIDIETALQEARALAAQGKDEAAEKSFRKLFQKITGSNADVLTAVSSFEKKLSDVERRTLYAALIAYAEFHLPSLSEAREILRLAGKFHNEQMKKDPLDSESQILLARILARRELNQYDPTQPILSEETLRKAEEILVTQSTLNRSENPWVAAKAHAALSELEQIRAKLEKKNSNLANAADQTAEAIRALDRSVGHSKDFQNAIARKYVAQRREQLLGELARLENETTNEKALHRLAELASSAPGEPSLESRVRKLGKSGALVEFIRNNGNTEMLVVRSGQGDQIHVDRISLGDPKALSNDSALWTKVWRPLLSATRQIAPRKFVFSSQGPLNADLLRNVSFQLDPPHNLKKRAGDLWSVESK